MFDFMKNMQMAPREIHVSKKLTQLIETQQTDNMFIKHEKIFIDYEHIFGQGSCSTVFKGHLTGPSPLYSLTQLIETQRFCDCDVAVKVARHFGSGEVEQLYKEISTMKIIGYHENIMCLLGWAMPSDTPCLIFDIAKTDLLNYLRGLRDNVEESFPYKDFLSILWQISRGNFW